METVLVGLVGRLYKMAESDHSFADRFEKAVRKPCLLSALSVDIIDLVS